MRYVPDVRALSACAKHTAELMCMRAPESDQVEAYLRQLVDGPHSEGREGVLAVLSAGLLTETEARDVVMANIVTWLARSNGMPEPSAETWTSRDLELAFEVALLGRPAR